MNKKGLEEVKAALKEIEQLYDETLFWAKSDPISFLELKEGLAAIKGPFQN